MTSSSGDWSAGDECDNCELAQDEKKKLQADLVAKDKEIVEKREEYERLKAELMKYKDEYAPDTFLIVLMVIMFLFGLVAGFSIGSVNVSNDSLGVDGGFKELYEESQRTLLEKDKELQRIQNSEYINRHLNLALVLVLLGIFLKYVWHLEGFHVVVPLKEKGTPWIEAEMDRLCVKYNLCEATFMKLFQLIMELEIREDRQSVKGELQTLEELYWKAAKNVEECITENVKAVEDKLKDTAEILTKIDTSKNDAKGEEKGKNVEAREENVQEQETQNKEKGTCVEVKKGNEKNNVMETCDCCQTQNQFFLSMSNQRGADESMDALEACTKHANVLMGTYTFSNK